MSACQHVREWNCLVCWYGVAWHGVAEMFLTYSLVGRHRCRCMLVCIHLPRKEVCVQPCAVTPSGKAADLTQLFIQIWNANKTINIERTSVLKKTATHPPWSDPREASTYPRGQLPVCWISACIDHILDLPFNPAPLCNSMPSVWCCGSGLQHVSAVGGGNKYVSGY